MGDLDFRPTRGTKHGDLKTNTKTKKIPRVILTPCDANKQTTPVRTSNEQDLSTSGKYSQETLHFHLESEIMDTTDPSSVFTPTRNLPRSPPTGATSTPKVGSDPRIKGGTRNLQVKPPPRPRSHSTPEMNVDMKPINTEMVYDTDQDSPEQKRERKRKRGVPKGGTSNFSNSSLNIAVRALSYAIKDLSTFKTRGDVINDVKVVILKTSKLFNDIQREVNNVNLERSRSRSRQRADQKNSCETTVIDLEAESPKNTDANSATGIKTQKSSPSTRTFGTQTDNPDVVDEEELKTTICDSELKYEKIQSLLEREWSDSIFKKTSVTNKDILTYKEADLACFVPADFEMDTVPSKVILDKFQGSTELKAQTPIPGTCLCLINATCLPGKRNSTGPGKLLRDRYIFYLINRLNSRSL